ncbi:MAG: tetratricopeptide repeat protein, partial [Planctomycetes bacterium]|nr:tetratricopeptide repeat protein [Planctomycetota bacterium]
PSLANGYAMDDTPLVSSQGAVYPGPDVVITAEFDSGWFDYFSKFFRQYYWWPESHNDGLYRPITTLSYGLVYQLVGRHLVDSYEPLPQHAVNVLAYVWAVWLVMQLLAGVGASRRMTVLTGVVFAAHAIHSEVVAGVVGRAELFSFCFGAQAVLLLARGGWAWIGAGCMFFLAFGSKESSAAWLPFYFCFTLTRHWLRDPAAAPFAPLRGRRVLWELGVMALPAALYLLLRYFAVECSDDPVVTADFSSNPLGYEPLLVRWLTAVKVWGFGLLLCVAPYKLSCLYSPVVFPMVQSPADWHFLLAAVALLSFLVFGLLRARRQPLLFLAVALFFGFSFPTSNLPVVIGTIFGERLYFIPSLGVCMLPGLLWASLRGRGEKVLLGVIVLWVIGSAAMSVHRASVWRSSASVFLHDVEVYPRSIDLHRKAAQSLYNVNDKTGRDLEGALAHCRAALALVPNYAHAYRLLGDIYMAEKDYDKAIAELKNAYGRGYPDPPGAESLAYNKIGDCLVAKSAALPTSERLKMLDVAVTWFEKSLAAPRWGDEHGLANNKIGHVCETRSELATTPERKKKWIGEALGWFEKSVALRPERNRSRIAAFKKLFQYAGKHLSR